jgi:hypothetical protein
MKTLLTILLCAAPSLFGQSEFIVNTRTDTTQREPRIADDGKGNAVIVWSSRNKVTANSQGDICLRRFTVGGTPSGPETLVPELNDGIQESPAVAMDGKGDVIVVWASLVGMDSSFDIKGRLFRNGPSPSAEFPVNTNFPSAQCHPAVSMDTSGAFVVAWDSWDQDGGDRGVYARRFSPDGAPIGDEFLVNQTTAYSQARPAIRVRHDGSFVVIWESWNQDAPSGYGVYGRVFTANGQPFTDEFRVNTTVNDYQWYADLDVLPDNAFVVVWCSWEQDGADGGVYLQRFDAAGQKMGGEIQVNQTTAFYQWLPRVRFLGGEHLGVVWSSWKQDGSREGVYARLFDLNGRPLTFETQVNTTTAGFQWEPDLVPTGRVPDELLVVWSSWGQIGKDYEVVGRVVTPQRSQGSLLPSGVTHPAGRSTTQLVVQVFDSTAMTGHQYESWFDSLGPQNAVCSIRDVASGDTVVSRFPVDRGEGVFYLTPQFQGIRVQIIPEFDLELTVGPAVFINHSGSNLSFSTYPASVGSRLVAPLDAAVIWGSTDTLADGRWTTPLDTAINQSGVRSVVTPFRAWNMTDGQKMDLLVVDTRADLRWNPGEKIVLRTPPPWRLQTNNTMADVWSTVPAGTVTLPGIGDTVLVQTTRPLGNGERFAFAAVKSAIVEVAPAGEVPGGFVLLQNYPNPFNPKTAVSYQLPAASKTRLTIYDALGREVETLVNAVQAPGVHTVQFDASGLASGVYFYRLQAGAFVATRKMILAK